MWAATAIRSSGRRTSTASPAKGLRFKNFYVACPICMPNRIVLMTGRMPTVNGSRHNGIPLDLDAVTFVDLLRNAGYRTALIGKSHLQDMTDKPVPNRIEAGRPALRCRRRVARGQPAAPVGSGLRGRDRQALDREPGPLGSEPVLRLRLRPLRRRARRPGVRPLHRLAERAHADPDSLRGWRNALPSPGLVAPQAWRTAVPEELYPTSFVAEETIGYLERHAQTSGERAVLSAVLVSGPASSLHAAGPLFRHVRSGDDPAAQELSSRRRARARFPEGACAPRPPPASRTPAVRRPSR